MLRSMAAILFGRKTVSQQNDHQLEQFSLGQQLFAWAAGRPSLTHTTLGVTDAVCSIGCLVSAQLPADCRWGSPEHSGHFTLTQAAKAAHLNRGALFNTEFVTG